MKAEKVIHRNVKPGSPIYLYNPVANDWRVPPVYAGDKTVSQDAEVWVVYESWYRKNPWLRRG